MKSLKDKTLTHGRSGLWAIQSGRCWEVSFGAIRIFAATEDEQPFQVDAVAVEEDTYLVLSADPGVREVKEPLMQVMTRVIEAQPQPPGSVLVKGKGPLRLLAIVHDLNEDPTWKEEWIVCALDGIFREAVSRKLESMALPFIGTKHGNLGQSRFLVLLRRVLEKRAPSYPKRLWLVAPDTKEWLNKVRDLSK